MKLSCFVSFFSSRDSNIVALFAYCSVRSTGYRFLFEGTIFINEDTTNIKNGNSRYDKKRTSFLAKFFVVLRGVGPTRVALLLYQ